MVVIYKEITCSESTNPAPYINYTKNLSLKEATWLTSLSFFSLQVHLYNLFNIFNDFSNNTSIFSKLKNYFICKISLKSRCNSSTNRFKNYVQYMYRNLINHNYIHTENLTLLTGPMGRLDPILLIRLRLRISWHPISQDAPCSGNGCKIGSNKNQYDIEMICNFIRILHDCLLALWKKSKFSSQFAFSVKHLCSMSRIQI